MQEYKKLLAIRGKSPFASHLVSAAGMDTQKEQSVASTLGDADAPPASANAQHDRRNVKLILAPLLQG